jgi:hypothetical protein
MKIIYIIYSTESTQSEGLAAFRIAFPGVRFSPTSLSFKDLRRSDCAVLACQLSTCESWPRTTTYFISLVIAPTILFAPI